MALYVVTATRIINYELEVEATSEKEAMLIADRADISEFGECGGEFTIDYADEIK